MMTNPHFGTTISKINLALVIHGLMPDGRHELSTWFQAIDYGDEISLSPCDEIRLVCSHPDLCPERDNLAWRAANLMASEFNPKQGVEIRLEKLVPSGAGLGGGSGDAALVLLLCNRFWGLNLTIAQLQEIGKSLGADVPFLVQGGAAWGTGAGDKLEPVGGLHPDTAILIATPTTGVSTGWAYREWDRLHQTPLPKNSQLTTLRSLCTRDHLRPEDLRGLVVNSFEDVVYPHSPEIEQVRQEMETLGAAVSLLSGSGSSIFGLFSAPVNRHSVLDSWTERGVRWRWCRPV